MKLLHSVGRWRSLFLPCTAVFALLLMCSALTVNGQSTQPVDAPNADSSGATGGANSLITPNAGLPGWTGGGTDAKGVWHAYNDEKGNPTDTPNAASLAPNVAKSLYSVNFVWTLVCGYLVMFMQAGFALVETGLVPRQERGPHDGHELHDLCHRHVRILRMRICVHVRRSQRIADRRAGSAWAEFPHWTACGASTPPAIFTACADTPDSSCTGKGYDAAAAVWFLFEMVFMDTTATIVTGGCAERWSFKSFFVFSLVHRRRHLSDLRLLGMGRRMAGADGTELGPGQWRLRLRRLRRRAPPRRSFGLHLCVPARAATWQV